MGLAFLDGDVDIVDGMNEALLAATIDREALRQTLRIEEIRVLENGSDWAGKTLLEIEFPKQTGLLVVAVKSLNTGKYVYNPKADYVIENDDVLIVIGRLEQVFRMKKLLGHSIGGESPDGDIFGELPPGEDESASEPSVQSS